MGREQNWQRDLRISEPQVPPPTAPLIPNLEIYVTEFLDQHGHRFVDGKAAADELERRTMVLAAQHGRRMTHGDKVNLGVETVCAWNRRAQIAEEERRSRGEWLVDFQAGAR